MKLLGIDFGLRKIGLAVSEGYLAEPLGILDTRNWESGIRRICQEEKIEKIVIGVVEGRIGDQQRKFGEKVAKLTGLSVDFQDETLTTHEAVGKMREIGRKVKDEDAIAAALILQGYLEAQRGRI